MLQRSVRPALFLLLIAPLLLVACQQPAPPAPQATAPAAAGSAAAEAPAADPVAVAGSGSGAAAEVVSHRVETSVDAVDGRRYLVARVIPAEGYHCNMEYPAWSVAVAADAPAAAGIRHGKDDATEFAEQAVVFRIPIDSPEAAGTVEANMRISVCDDEACLTPRETVSWTLASVQP
jgi:hypothetical protein